MTVVNVPKVQALCHLPYEQLNLRMRVATSSARERALFGSVVGIVEGDMLDSLGLGNGNASKHKDDKEEEDKRRRVLRFLPRHACSSICVFQRRIIGAGKSFVNPHS